MLFPFKEETGLAKDMIEKIIQAEKDGEVLIENAEKEAKSIVSKAEQTSKEALVAAKRQSDSDADKIIREAEAEAETIRTSGERRGWSEGEKLSAKADKSRNAAVDAAVEIIFG